MAETKKTPGRLSSIRNTVKKLTERLSDDHGAEGSMKDEQEREKEKLLVQLRSLEEEVRRLHQARHQLEQANRQNERLTDALQDAKAQIEAMRSGLDCVFGSRFIPGAAFEGARPASWRPTIRKSTGDWRTCWCARAASGRRRSIPSWRATSACTSTSSTR